MTQPWRLGVSSVFFRELPVSQAMARIVQAGYGAVEVWMEHLMQSGESPGDLQRLARDLDLVPTFHATSYDLNPISTNEGIARESRRQIVASLEAAAELGARVVVVHPGRQSASKEDPESTWARFLPWLQELDARAAALGVLAAIELMEKRAREIFVTLADAARLMENAWQAIALTVDIAHLNSFGNPATILGELEPSWVAHVHLSDQSPGRGHQPLGKGEIDFVAVRKTLQSTYQGIISVEGYRPGQGDELLRDNMAVLRSAGFAAG